MKFTDDDLKLLKEDMKHPQYVSGNFIPNPGMLEDLLARLEAAERCLDANNHRPVLDPHHFGACICEYHQDWRNKCGK